VKLLFNFDEKMKIFHEKNKLKQFMSTKPTWQKTLKGILHTEEEESQKHEHPGKNKTQK
jgi:hypothetical protein